MKKKITAKNIIYAAIALVFIAILVISLLNQYGYFFKEETDIHNTVIDEWKSSPIGDGGYYSKITSYTDGTIHFQRFKGDIEDVGNSVKTVDDIMSLSYEEMNQSAALKDLQNHKLYYSFIVPYDCKYAEISGTKCETIEVELDTTQGIINFKLCIGIVDSEKEAEIVEQNNGRKEYILVDINDNLYQIG